MVQLGLIVAFVTCVASLAGVDAFAVGPCQPTFVTRLHMSDKEGSGAGPAIAKPQVQTKTAVVTKQKQKVEKKQKVKGGQPIQKKKEEFIDAPLFKVMLIGDQDYDEDHVIDRMMSIIDEIDEEKAIAVFEAAQQSGKAMCGKYPLEHAEMYKEQFLRSEPMIFVDVDDEN